MKAHFPFYVCKMLATSGPGKEAAEKSLTAESIKGKGKRPSSEAAVSSKWGWRRDYRKNNPQTVLSRPMNSALPLKLSGTSEGDETPVNITTHIYYWSLPREENNPPAENLALA